MNISLSRPLACVLALSLLQVDLLQINPARAAADDPEIRAFVNDSCIVADEPYLMPPPDPDHPADQSTKFFPLIGMVVGELVQMLITHVVAASTGHIKTDAARKDTRYAVTDQMNLYRADLTPEPVLHLNANLGCMTIVAARFLPGNPQCSAAYIPKQLSRETMQLPESQWKASRTDNSVENQLRRANICVDGNARAVYEARFEFSEDGTAYRLKNAGYQIESLLTTRDKSAQRAAFYTLEISQPGKTDQRETLSTAAVNLGTVTAGSHATGSASDSPPWLTVPPLSVEARRAYDQKTRVHQQVIGEIDALKRALTRNQRVLAGMDQRIAAASPDLAAGLAQERTRIAVEIQTQQAELDASNAEYQELPLTPLEFMPVTIVVGVTETESEKTALLTLAGLIDTGGAQLASAGNTAASNLFARSLNMTDNAGRTDPAAELDARRAQYFDALVALKSGTAAAPGGNAPRDGAPRDDAPRQDATANLALARSRYNDARRALGLEPIE
jgi:hypothetical protein